MQKLSLNQASDKSVAKPVRSQAKKSDWSLPWWGWVLCVLMSLVIFVLTVAVTIYLSVKSSITKFRLQATDTYIKAQAAYQAFKDQDLELTRTRLAEAKTSLDYTQKRFARLQSPLTVLGYKQYFADGRC